MRARLRALNKDLMKSSRSMLIRCHIWTRNPRLEEREMKEISPPLLSLPTTLNHRQLEWGYLSSNPFAAYQRFPDIQ